jgi:hypothetical protein
MPVIRARDRVPSLPDLRGALVDQLAKELMGEHTRNSPYVFEMPTGLAEKVDVVVIWELWEILAPGDRASIIREAYAKHAADLAAAVFAIDPANAAEMPAAPSVSISIGATYGEALAQGLLPYSIHPTARPDVDPYVIRQLMKEAGAIETPAGVELRFPDVHLATEALDGLIREMPEAGWSLADESDRFDD